MALRSDLGRVRGLGSAKDGTSHWWAQRVTAVALIPLSIWFVFSVIHLVGIDRVGLKTWLNAPGSFVCFEAGQIDQFLAKCGFVDGRNGHWPVWPERRFLLEDHPFPYCSWFRAISGPRHVRRRATMLEHATWRRFAQRESSR